MRNNNNDEIKQVLPKKKISTKKSIPDNTKELVMFYVMAVDGPYEVLCFLDDVKSLQDSKQVTEFKDKIEKYNFVVDVTSVDKMLAKDLPLVAFQELYVIGQIQYVLAHNLSKLAVKLEPRLVQWDENKDELMKIMQQEQEKYFKKQQEQYANDEIGAIIQDGFTQIVKTKPLEFDDRYYQ